MALNLVAGEGLGVAVVALLEQPLGVEQVGEGGGARLVEVEAEP